MEKIKKFKKLLVLLLCLITMCSTFVFAKEDNAGTTAFQFLKMDISARAVGMGSAFTAVADDVNTIRYNPAGLMLLTKTQISATHIEWVEEIRGEQISYGKPIGNAGAIGMSLFYLGAAGIQRRDDEGVLGNSDVPFSESVVHLCWATRVGKNDEFNIGIGGKYMQEVLDSEKYRTGAFDIGILSRLYKSLVFGSSVRNIGTSDKSLPTEFRVGLSVLYKTLGLSADGFKYRDTNFKYAVGLEYFFKSLAAFRIGYNTMYNSGLGDMDDKFTKNVGLSKMTGLSLGLGFASKPIDFMGGSKIRCDYAFTNFGKFGGTHLFTLSTEF
jgi:hypothetical protein